MKKSIVLAVLGGTLAASSSYAQGIINFSSYSANGGAGALTTIFGGSTPVPNGFTAVLYYALGTVSDAVNTGSAASIISPVTGLTLIAGSSVTYNTGPGTYAGYFTGANTIVPTYTSGPVSFEIVATGTISGVSYSGRSGAFTMASIPGSALPAINFTGMPAFVVAPVPEPTTLALAGLGGLASLVMLRRKNV